MWDLREDGQMMGTDVMTDLQKWTMLRRIYSSRQLFEVMVEFWSNVMHVTSGDNKSWPHRVRYDKVIRQNALGRFDEMLEATVLHPVHAVLSRQRGSRHVATRTRTSGARCSNATR